MKLSIIKNKINKLSIKSVVVGTVFLLSLSMWNTYYNFHASEVQHSLSENVIRFHVLANSDSDEDQALKLKVKSSIVNYIYENTKDCKTTSDTENFLISHDNEIKNIAVDTISQLGYNYTVSSSYGLQDFPNKKYGDVTFPSGTYTSYTIYIGEGGGHNWWCVLYPPLCFVDASTGILPEESKETLKENVSDEDYDYLTEDEYVFKFKFLTFLNR